MTLIIPHYSRNFICPTILGSLEEQTKVNRLICGH
jgi:hypothetical protein